MSRSRLALLAIAVLSLTPSGADACLWDHDTLQMERSRFPSALELIAGKFLRHSREFYRWRVEDRLRRLQSEPDNLALHDDLAAAYDKLGQHDRAIATMLAAEAKKPGRYETLANLGTFYAHSGQLEKGAEYIGKALAVNPDAHFGREKYQKYLIEYVRTRSRGGKQVLPLGDPRTGEQGGTSFFEFVLEREKPGAGEPHGVKPAIKGVLGMMKFGNHASPVLLEALGDLLAMKGRHVQQDAKMLAARAYLKASYEVKDEAAKAAYRKRAEETLEMQVRDSAARHKVTVAEVEESFKQELADAAAWSADLRARELEWIRSSPNPDAEFDRLYEQEPTVNSPEDSWAGPATSFAQSWLTWLLLGVSGLAFLGLMAMWFLWLRRRVLAALTGITPAGRPGTPGSPPG